MRIAKKMIIGASLALLTMLVVNCGDKSTGGPSSTPAVVEPYDQDTMAVRKMLDTNGLTGVAVGEVVTATIVIDPQTQASVKRIGELKLPKRHIGVVSSHLGQLTGLYLLNLDSNAILALPAAIGKCKALTFITLAVNNLTGLPPEIGNLDSLKTLILSHNNLATLPVEIGNLRALEKLEADFNSLTGLPLLANLSKLKILWINNNQITALPAGMDTSNVQYATVGHNKLCLPDNAALSKWLNNFAEADWKATQQCP
jgi:hypothetical protein